MQPCISMLLNILLNMLKFKISTAPQFTETLFSFQTIQFSLSEAWLPGVYGNEALVLVSWFYLLLSLLSDSSGPGKSTHAHMHAGLSDKFWLKLSGTFWIVLKLFYWQLFKLWKHSQRTKHYLFAHQVKWKNKQTNKTLPRNVVLSDNDY